MSYIAVAATGVLATISGYPKFAKWRPEAWLDLPNLRSSRAWTLNMDVHDPNLTGTCLLVALGAERNPYRGRILFTGHGMGLVPRDIAALADLHTAIRLALTGQASGHGTEFDQQVITTALMAGRGTDERAR